MKHVHGYLFLFIAFLLVLAGSLCYDTVCRTQQHHKPETSYLYFCSYLSICSNFISANCNVKNIPLYPCRKHLGRRRSSFTLIRTRIIKVEYICPYLIELVVQFLGLFVCFCFNIIDLCFVAVAAEAKFKEVMTSYEAIKQERKSTM